MQRFRDWLLILPIALLSMAACGDDPVRGGNDDALVFANSSGGEVNVDLTLPDGTDQNVNLPASSMAGETRVDVSFIEGEVYRFTLFSVSPSIQSSLEISCTVASGAVQDGVASVLVYLDFTIGALTGDCLTNWVESP